MSFDATIRQHKIEELRPLEISTLQVNVGKYCNQACRHSHVDAGPQRKEMISRETAESVIDTLRRHAEIRTLDITGGAPELNPNFRYLATEARGLGREVIDRCNLTVLFVPGQQDLASFLSGLRIRIIASLPCYLEENVDKQRGGGVFQESIRALRLLNDLGYGHEGSALELDLIYNPLGPSLPPPQAALEADYHRELLARYGVCFNRLFTITNMPIARFKQDLANSGKLESYIQTLIENFNPHAVSGVMCRTLLSVGWDGRLYDCDFNQMLDLPLAEGQPAQIRDFNLELLRRRKIQTTMHCFGCTAGAGSSCNGALL